MSAAENDRRRWAEGVAGAVLCLRCNCTGLCEAPVVHLLKPGDCNNDNRDHAQTEKARKRLEAHRDNRISPLDHRRRDMGMGLGCARSDDGVDTIRL